MELNENELEKIERRKKCYWCHERYRVIGMLCRQCTIRDHYMWIRDIEEDIKNHPVVEYKDSD